jgi:ATP-dependent Clp protease adaptor protein ClpS
MDTPRDQRQGVLVADLGYIAIVLSGFSIWWWQHYRPNRQARPARVDRLLRQLFTPEAEVAVHVASHEAQTRHQELSSVHVLYGLVQDETVTGAIAGSGGDPTALEDRVLAALDTGPVTDGGALLGHAAGLAHHHERQASCVDLWAALAGTAAAKLIDDADIARGTVLFALVHGSEPALDLALSGDVFVVLRNDNFTTQEFVTEILESVFELPAERARAVMLTTHTEGHAAIGRFTARAARDRITAARDRARDRAFPLWIGVEPA